jgi:RimJ/RimL family protein N-acetyltransferase
MNIVGDTIRLRPMEKTDMESRVKWFNDPDVNETLFLDAELNLAKTLDWFDKAVRDETRQDFVIETLAGKSIGFMGLVNINHRHGTAECYGIIGQKQYWGKGIGTESHSLLIQYAFEALGLNKIWASVNMENTAILKVTRKLGFRVEGILREEKCVAGRRIDVFRIAVLRSEFKPTTKIKKTS